MINNHVNRKFDTFTYLKQRKIILNLVGRKVGTHISIFYILYDIDLNIIIGIGNQKLMILNYIPICAKT